MNYNIDTSGFTMTTSPQNKFHKDDTINDFLEHVRYTKFEDDAINNITYCLKSYDIEKTYTIWEKIKILFK